jgi:hypothetical protein
VRNNERDEVASTCDAIAIWRQPMNIERFSTERQKHGPSGKERSLKYVTKKGLASYS